MKPRRILSKRSHRGERGPPHRDGGGAAHRRSARSGRQPLSLLRSEQRACSSIATAARGMRLNIAAGTAVRFEPGEEKEVRLVEFAGDAHGLRPPGQGEPMSLSIPRRTYADLYGPTTGDRVRLADTELIIEVEKDFTVYGDEITFGGGKVIRDGMGQSCTRHARADRRARPGHHQRADHRSLGNRQRRHRDPRRPHRQSGQGGQSGHDGRRRS